MGGGGGYTLLWRRLYTSVELHYTVNDFKFCDSYHSVPFGPYPRFFAFVAFFLQVLSSQRPPKDFSKIS